MSSLFPHPGPRLPQFKTLLIEGPYHPSAPIHLCLSQTETGPTSKAIIITPSRQKLTHALQEYNDEWLSTNSGCGTISEHSSRIKVFYPPSPAHLCLLLSMFRIPQPIDGASLDPKTTLDIAPSLVVLHEPSAYFLPLIASDPDSHPWTISSYLTLITRTLAALALLSATDGSGGNTTPIAFALFDSQLDRLKLPVLRLPQFYDGDYHPSTRLESVSIFVQKYFEWLGVFDHDPAPTDSSQEGVEDDNKDGERRTRNQMRLYRVGESSGDPSQDQVVSWRWFENPGSFRGASERRGTVFVWG